MWTALGTGAKSCWTGNSGLALLEEEPRWSPGLPGFAESECLCFFYFFINIKIVRWSFWQEILNLPLGKNASSCWVFEPLSFKHFTLNTCKHYWDNCFSRTIYALRTFDRCLFHLQSAVVVCMDEGYSSFEARKLRYPEVNFWQSSVPWKTLMWVCDWDFVPWQKYDSSFFIWVLYWWLLVDLR